MKRLAILLLALGLVLAACDSSSDDTTTTAADSGGDETTTAADSGGDETTTTAAAAAASGSMMLFPDSGLPMLTATSPASTLTTAAQLPLLSSVTPRRSRIVR